MGPTRPRPLHREQFLSDSELERFMSAVKDRRHVNQPRDLALFSLLSTTGLRPSEASALTTTDLHLHADPPWIRVIRLKKKKTIRETDDLVIPRSLANTIAVYADGLQSGARVFPVSRRSAARLFHFYAKKAGINHGWLYILRHTAATRIYRATRDIAVVQAILGHESSDMSALYAHVTRKMIRELADGFVPIV